MRYGLELALKVVVDDIQADIDYYNEKGWELENWKDLCDAWGDLTSKEVKGNVEYTLLSFYDQHKILWGNQWFDDDLTIYDENPETGIETLVSYRKFMNMVRKNLKY